MSEDTARRVEDLEVLSYRIERGNCIEKRYEDRWAVVGPSGYVLNKEGEWEYENSPSNRSEDFMERTRYDSPQEALDAYNEVAEYRVRAWGT